MHIPWDEIGKVSKAILVSLITKSVLRFISKILVAHFKKNPFPFHVELLAMLNQ